jgi:hypothetical protein
MEIFKTIKVKLIPIETKGSVEIYKNPETLFFSIKIKGEWINNYLEFSNYTIKGNIIGVRIEFNGDEFFSYYLINEKKWLESKSRRFKNAEISHNCLILKNLDESDSVYLTQERKWLIIRGKNSFKFVSLEEDYLFIRTRNGDKYRYHFKTKILNE